MSSFERLLSIYTNVAFETDESVLFIEVTLERDSTAIVAVCVYVFACMPV